MESDAVFALEPNFSLVGPTVWEIQTKTFRKHKNVKNLLYKPVALYACELNSNRVSALLTSRLLIAIWKCLSLSDN